MQRNAKEPAAAGATRSGWQEGQVNITSEAVESIARTTRNAVLVALALVLAWLAIDALLVIFAGILLAIFLRGLAELLQRLSARAGIHLPIGLSLLFVILGILVILSGIGWFFNDQINTQIAQLSQDLPVALQNFLEKVRQSSWGRLLLNHINPSQISNIGVSATNIAGKVASTVFGVAQVTLEVIAGTVIFLFVGLYCAAEPGLYARGVVSLIPPEKRNRAYQILEETVDTLWYWEMGRLFSMTVIGVATGVGLALLSVPVPAALGFLAGILTFIPYAGSITSAIPAVLLALTINTQLALYTILLYVGAHTLEGYILVPLVQKRAADLPPALTLSSQAVLTVIVGLPCLALATPLTAAGLVLTRMIYVEGVLADQSDGSVENAPQRP